MAMVLGERFEAVVELVGKGREKKVKKGKNDGGWQGAAGDDGIVGPAVEAPAGFCGLCRLRPGK